jgi:hypothetical protein
MDRSRFCCAVWLEISGEKIFIRALQGKTLLTEPVGEIHSSVPTIHDWMFHYRANPRPHIVSNPRSSPNTQAR